MYRMADLRSSGAQKGLLLQHENPDVIDIFGNFVVEYLRS